MSQVSLTRYMGRLEKVETSRALGKVIQVVGLLVEGSGPGLPVGAVCQVEPLHGGDPVPVEIVGFRDSRVLFMPLGQARGISPGSTLRAISSQATARVGSSMLGRILDGLGQPLDGGPPLDDLATRPLYAEPLNPLSRPIITEVMDVGVRAINGLLTIGKGQRMGIFSGSGVGKSTLLSMMARHTKADVTVVALVGERGREVKEFVERVLGPEGLARSVVVAATSDQPPLVRLRGAFLATTIAEHFRDQGMDVLLLMDSMTRFAMAQREVGLSVGEPPATKGYAPSVFALMPRLLERAGVTGEGSITGFYTVLVEGDDMADPISDAARGLLDGHIVLSRRMASQNIYPSIDVLASKSRVMIEIVPSEHLQAAGEFISLASAYDESADLIQVGAYVRGSDARVDRAVDLRPKLLDYLRQGIREGVAYDAAVASLRTDVLAATAPPRSAAPPRPPAPASRPGAPVAALRRA
ncbi:MAG: FliI/YscN family ATPase [Candidatus Tectomicrobia bacterium]|nr:FliI/YscN family ATPase [Candidatus Tectomicrobia bacterium]